MYLNCLGELICSTCGAICDPCPSCSALRAEIDKLATILLSEFDGPTQSESACEMAVRVLREQRARIRALEEDLKDIRGERIDEGKVWAACPRCARAGDGVALRQAIREGIGEFAERHPKWWKRIDRTPIPNDIEVNIAAAVSKWIRGE